ncbi:E3 ubiquitin-protein ligase TRIM15-like [Alligator mississippiensis]|uniref:E3 ubiquitin-protein ligase TRIM15-like n=1 Tax=Alligator mississippiensis TaxID=8496 RepID=UPI0028776B17|nr:E3 ubiquitin-protein ligase TRIM15-like [Alligator mississippiensis]
MQPVCNQRGLGADMLEHPSIFSRPWELQETNSSHAKTKAGSQKVASISQELHQFIKEQEQLLLAQLAELEQDIEKSQEETVTSLSEQISCLDSLIMEMESKCQQPPYDLLEVRHIKTLPTPAQERGKV